MKEDLGDLDVLKEYVSIVAKKRGGKEKAWREFHKAASTVLGG